jgi:hypothetical protein
MNRYVRIAFAQPGEAGAGDLNNDGGGEPQVQVSVGALELDVADPPEPVVEPVAPTSVPLDVFQKRVATLTRQKADLEARNAALLAAQTQTPGVAPPTPAISGDDNERVIAQRVAELRLNEKSNEIAAAGQAIASDFMLKVQTINSTLGTLTPGFIEALAEAGGDPATSAQILYDLAGNLGEAGTILAMSPTRQAAILTKKAMAIEAKKAGEAAPTIRGSSAPSPIIPRVGVSRSSNAGPKNLSDPKVGIDDWMKERDASAKGRRR